MPGNRENLERWIEAFRQGDVDALCACYAEDAINWQVAAGEPARGIEQIRHDFEVFFTAFPNAWNVTENIMQDGDWAAWEWRGGGTMTGEFLGTPANNRTFEMRGCGFFRFRDGKIVLQRGYWDKESWFGQLGVM